MDIEKPKNNSKERNEISEIIPISYQLRSRSNSFESIDEPVSVKKVTKKVTSSKKSKSTKKINNKKTSTSDNIRSILKVGKRNVAPISTSPIKKNKVKRERNILDEKSVNNLQISKRIRINE